MSIQNCLKTIARGERAARDLSREQAQELMTAVLSGQASGIEVGAMCVAMRLKGESTEELLGFLDALQDHTQALNANTPNDRINVVIPSYNGARKLPLLTPLLAGLLAQQGFRVWVHGLEEGDTRTTSHQLWQALAQTDNRWAMPGSLPSAQQWQASCWHTSAWSPAIVRLLAVRQQLGLRNSAHSLVKLVSPLTGPSILLSSYTHQAYQTSMSEVLLKRGQAALLIRGTEGEAVANPRRMPAMDAINHTGVVRVQEPQPNNVDLEDAWSHLTADEVEATVRYTLDVLNGAQTVPPVLARQIACIQSLAETLIAPAHPSP